MCWWSACADAGHKYTRRGALGRTHLRGLRFFVCPFSYFFPFRSIFLSLLAAPLRRRAFLPHHHFFCALLRSRRLRIVSFSFSIFHFQFSAAFLFFARFLSFFSRSYVFRFDAARRALFLNDVQKNRKRFIGKERANAATASPRKRNGTTIFSAQIQKRHKTL